MAKKKIKELCDTVFREILDRPIGLETENAILDAASYLNCERALANVMDGCKPSYRRLIYTALKFPKGELQPSDNLLSSMSLIHPHNLAGCQPLLASMVRSGIMSGTGSFGTRSILGDEKPAAAPRYTKTRLSDLYNEILRPTLQSLSMVESPQGGTLEPESLGLVFPICLSFKGLVSGIGYGIRTIYPNFSPKSLYAAYINNNPYLLEPNVDLLIDKNNSDLQGLWERGKGRVIYSYKVSPYTNEDGRPGFLFEGDTCLFTPNLSKIEKYAEQGQVFIEDLTTKYGPKMFVGLVSGRGSLKLDDLEKLCRQCCFDATIYHLNVTDGRSAFRIPLRDWLDYTYKNFVRLMTEVNTRELEKVMFEIKVQESLPVICNYIINVNPKATDTEISNKLGIPGEVVSAVMSKPIAYLRKNKDTSERVKVLKERLKVLKSFDPIKYTETVINRL